MRWIDRLTHPDPFLAAIAVCVLLLIAEIIVAALVNSSVVILIAPTVIIGSATCMEYYVNSQRARRHRARD